MKMNLQIFAESVSTGVVGRWQHSGYLNVAPGEGTGQYELLGFGVTQLDDSPSAQTTSKRYVNQKSATQTIGSYEWTAPLEFDLIRSEKAIEYIAAIGENEKTGVDAETDYVVVYLEKPVAEQPGKYEAKKRKVAVEVAEFTDNDGEIQGSGNLLAVSDWEFGQFDIKAKTFTANGAEEDE